ANLTYVAGEGMAVRRGDTQAPQQIDPVDAMPFRCCGRGVARELCGTPFLPVKSMIGDDHDPRMRSDCQSREVAEHRVHMSEVQLRNVAVPSEIGFADVR